MKKSLFVVASIVFALCLTMGNVFAQENRKMTEQEIAALESQLFISADKMDLSDEAKFGEQLIAADGDDSNAKCWYWGYSYYYYYPTYYYYVWYCPCYYVNFRLVNYTVPVVETTTTTVATTETMTIIAKSSGKVSRGAVIDQKVPANSPLAKMGLRSGDIITSVDGNPVNGLLDVRRIKSDSNVTFVRGNKIQVAGKPLLKRANSAVVKSNAGMTQATIDLNVVKSMQDKKMSLYEYYDRQEKAAEQGVPTAEYGSNQY